MSTCRRMQNAKMTVEMLKITLITPQHVTTAFFFLVANQQTGKPANQQTSKPGKPGNKPANLNWQQNHRQTRQSAKEEESAQKSSEESRCV